MSRRRWLRWYSAAAAVFAFAALALGGCAASPRIDPQTVAALGGRMTYTWAPDLQLNPRLGTRERLRRLDQVVRGSIDEELARRGYQQIASGSTDMIVAYRILLEEKDPRSLRDYADYRSLGGQGSAGEVLAGYTEGTLIIELADGSGQQVLWQSSATAIPDVKAQGEGLPTLIREMMAPVPMR